MFGKDKGVMVNSLFSEGININGDISLNATSELRCSINGNISETVESKVILANSSKVVGNINVTTLIVDGNIKGDITVKNLIIESKACINGNISYSESLEVKSGSIINGTISFIGQKLTSD